MIPNRWQEVDRFLELVIDLPPDQRILILHQQCSDAEIREEVLRMLEGAETLSQQLVDTIQTSSKTLLEEESREEHVGVYKLLREIGSGGMGSVWLAERADGQFEQQVAIKFIRHFLATDAMKTRFLNERQILAGLQHPNIARLLDGGTSANGTPYLVLEYIDGVDLQRYTAQKSAEEKLKLFLKVCDAVAYAHRSLIVHRDLKMSNILVTHDGEVKLLDFGIAKVLEDTPVDQTQTAARIMTLEYASPEQVMGQAVTTSIDVYSLGVVLYRILTGKSPYTPDGSNPVELARAVCEEEPPPASRFDKQLAGDLEYILHMSLRKEPNRRYAGVSAMMADIQNHLSGRIVSARPDTLTYRASKFLKRHRFTSAAAAMAISGIIIFALWALAERNTARREQRKAERVAALLADVFKVSDPNESRGEKITARDILSRATTKIEKELNSEPDVQAQLLYQLGEVYNNLDDGDSAEPLLRKALELTPKNDSRLRGLRLERLGVAVFLKDQLDPANALFREAEQTLRPYGPSPELVSAFNNQGTVLRRQGREKESIPYFEQAITMGESLKLQDLTRERNNLALALLEAGDYNRAVQLEQEVVATRRKLFPPDHPDIATAVANLALALSYAGKNQEAVALNREALTIRRRVFGNASSSVALSLSNLGSTLQDMGEFQQAAIALEEALALRRKLLKPTNTSIAITALNLVRARCELGQVQQALPLLAEGKSIFEKHLPANHWRFQLAKAYGSLCLMKQGKTKEAKKVAAEAYKELNKQLGESDSRVRLVRQILDRASKP